MEGRIKIQSIDIEKLKTVIQICNTKKGYSIEIIEIDGLEAILSFSSVNEIFELGRIYEPYKMPAIMGSFTFEQDNDYLTNI